MISNEVVAAAQAAQKKWKVPASVSLAQWIVESGGGRHEPLGSNNPFGIKAVVGHPYVEAVTHEFVHGRYITIRARFAKFESIIDAFDAHGKLLATHPAYAHAMEAEDAETFAERLTGIYATQPHYGTNLVHTMQKYHLEHYDV